LGAAGALRVGGPGRARGTGTVGRMSGRPIPGQFLGLVGCLLRLIGSLFCLVGQLLGSFGSLASPVGGGAGI
jgi:hypothetical protein